MVLMVIGLRRPPDPGTPDTAAQRHALGKEDMLTQFRAKGKHVLFIPTGMFERIGYDGGRARTQK
jgi:hypothetical protein